MGGVAEVLNPGWWGEAYRAELLLVLVPQELFARSSLTQQLLRGADMVALQLGHGALCHRRRRPPATSMSARKGGCTTDAKKRTSWRWAWASKVARSSRTCACSAVTSARCPSTMPALPTQPYSGSRELLLWGWLCTGATYVESGSHAGLAAGRGRPRVAPAAAGGATSSRSSSSSSSSSTTSRRRPPSCCRAPPPASLCQRALPPRVRLSGGGGRWESVRAPVPGNVDAVPVRDVAALNLLVVQVVLVHLLDHRKRSTSSPRHRAATTRSDRTQR